MWDPIMPGLARRFRVINVDARCHRNSTTPGPFTLDDLAQDWLAVLDEEKIDRAHLCGLSMGGMTAMRFALRTPERVAAMALLDTSADEEPTAQRRAYRVLGEIHRRVRIDFLLNPIFRRKMFGRTTRRDRPELIDQGLAWIQENPPSVLYPALRAVFDRESIIDRLSAIQCPTLVISGDEDAAIPPDRGKRIADNIPGATLQLIPRAGHISVMEQPTEVETHLTTFFARHSSAAA